MAPRRGRRQAGVVAVVTHPDPLEATVAGHTARHLTATTLLPALQHRGRPAHRIRAHPSPAPRPTTGVGAHPRNPPNTARQARNWMNPNNPRSTRRPISPAPMRARGTAAAAALAAVLVCTTHTAPAEAALSSVSPGDRIAIPDLCTIGYTYIGTDVSYGSLLDNAGSRAGSCAVQGTA